MKLLTEKAYPTFEEKIKSFVKERVEWWYWVKINWRCLIRFIIIILCANRFSKIILDIYFIFSSYVIQFFNLEFTANCNHLFFLYRLFILFDIGIKNWGIIVEKREENIFSQTFLYFFFSTRFYQLVRH